MPNDKNSYIYNYDVFVSYKSEQESWAKRIAETLDSFGLRVWRDHDGGIRTGEQWREEIRIGIRDSKKMIVLWSELIQKNSSSVVHDEIREMQKLIDEDSNRKFVPVNLDGTELHPILASYHADVNFQILHQKYGDAGAQTVSAIEWYEAIKSLVEALGVEGIIEVRFVVAAMTQLQAEQLRNDPQKYGSHPAIFSVMKDVMQITSAFDVARYGDTPDDWTPFPQLAERMTIRQIIEEYDLEKRTWFKQQNNFAKWLLVSYSDEILNEDPSVREKAIEYIENGPCLIVLDPVSLMHRDIFQKIVIDGSLHKHQEAFVIGVAPFISQMHREIYSYVVDVDEKLEGILRMAYSRFKKPFEPYTRASVMNLEHEYQFVRWLQVAADNIVDEAKTPMRYKGRMDPLVRTRMKRALPSSPTKQIIAMVQDEKGK